MALGRSGRATVRPHRVRGGFLALVVALVPIASSAGAATESASFEGLGFLPNRGSFPPNSFPADVNASGTVVVGNSNGHAFRWVDGTIADLGVLFLACGATATRSSTANGVNADGTVVVGTSSEFSAIQCNTPRNAAFRWTPSTGMTDLGGLPLQVCPLDNAATDVNADGTVIVGRSQHSPGNGLPCRDEAFRWVNGTMSALGILPGASSARPLASVPTARSWWATATPSAEPAGSRRSAGRKRAGWWGSESSPAPT